MALRIRPMDRHLAQQLAQEQSEDQPKGTDNQLVFTFSIWFGVEHTVFWLSHSCRWLWCWCTYMGLTLMWMKWTWFVYVCSIFFLCLHTFKRLLRVKFLLSSVLIDWFSAFTVFFFFWSQNYRCHCRGRLVLNYSDHFTKHAILAR